MKKENTAITTAAYQKWLASYPWAKHFQSMVAHLPQDDANELRQMLRRDVWHSCRHRDVDITPDDIERSFKSLLDSHKLDVLENRYQMCKRIDDTNQQRAALVEQERSKLAEEIADAEAVAAFEQAIADRAAEDARNRELSKTKEGMRELRRKSLYPRVRTSTQSVPMPGSVKVVSKTL